MLPRRRGGHWQIVHFVSTCALLPLSEVLEGKVATLVQWIKEARYFMAFTGAGAVRKSG